MCGVNVDRKLWGCDCRCFWYLHECHISSSIRYVSPSFSYSSYFRFLTYGLFNNSFCMFVDVKILILGLVQSLFEASMYTFVFMWTPALTEGDDVSPLPFGLIFACCI